VEQAKYVLKNLSLKLKTKNHNSKPVLSRLGEDRIEAVEANPIIATNYEQGKT
jgi:hypothetical protein